MSRFLSASLLLAIGVLPALETELPLGTDRVAEVADAVAARAGIEADSPVCRIMAASLAHRMLPKKEGAGWRLQKDDFFARVLNYHRGLKPVLAAIAETDVPDPHRRTLRIHYARESCWPVRYRAPAAPYAAWIRDVRSIPPGSEQVEIGADASLTGVLAGRWSGWSAASPFVRYAILERIAAFNPGLWYDGGRTAVAGDVADGRAGAGPDPVTIGAYSQLVAVVPEADLTPADEQVFERLVLPAADGRVWVRRYRRAPGPLLLPDAQTLESWSRPARLDLRNLPLVDLRGLPLARLEVLDVSGTAIAGLDSLRGATALRELRCSATRVADLTPLADLELRRLDLRDTPVVDLGPLEGMPLVRLDLRGTAALDLAPLAGAPLEYLLLQEDGDYAGLDALSIERIEEVPIATWREENAAKRAAGEYWDQQGGAVIEVTCVEDERPPAKPEPGDAGGDGEAQEAKEEEPADVDDALEGLLDDDL